MIAEDENPPVGSIPRGLTEYDLTDSDSVPSLSLRGDRDSKYFVKW